MDMLLATTFGWEVYHQDLIKVIIVGMECIRRAVFKGYNIGELLGGIVHVWCVESGATRRYCRCYYLRLGTDIGFPSELKNKMLTNHSFAVYADYNYYVPGVLWYIALQRPTASLLSLPFTSLSVCYWLYPPIKNPALLPCPRLSASATLFDPVETHVRWRIYPSAKSCW